MIRKNLKKWHKYKTSLKETKYWVYLLVDTVETIIVALLLFLILRQFVVQTSLVFSGSMEPTLKKNDRVLVNKFIYYFKAPKRGDIILFKSPLGDKKEYVKRLIGLPGDTIFIKRGIVYINDKELDLPGINIQRDFSYYGPVIIPKDNYLALGDNRPNSYDSRYWGFVPKKALIGKAVLIFWPFNRMLILH